MQSRKKIKYDPLKAPNPKEWLELDEAKRIALVESYHRKQGIQLPNIRLHATIHTIVENQSALKDQTPVADAIVRLRMQGLDRHDAVHAVGSIFTKYFFETIKEGKHLDKPPGEVYFEEVRTLTKEQWYDEFGEE